MIFPSLALLLTLRAEGSNPILKDPAFSYIDVYNLKAYPGGEVALANLLKEGIAENADINDAVAVFVAEADDVDTPRDYEVFKSIGPLSLAPNNIDCKWFIATQPRGEGFWYCDTDRQLNWRVMSRYVLQTMAKEKLSSAEDQNAQSHQLGDRYLNLTEKVQLTIISDTTHFPISGKYAYIAPLINKCTALLLYMHPGDGKFLDEITIPKFAIPDTGHLTVKMDYSKGKGYIYKTDTYNIFCAPDLKAELEFDLTYSCAEVPT